jgi:hypothetical protein
MQNAKLPIVKIRDRQSPVWKEIFCINVKGESLFLELYLDKIRARKTGFVLSLSLSTRRRNYNDSEATVLLSRYCVSG